MNTHDNTTLALPDFALTALSLLEDAGFEAWCVGGFVRDALMDRESNDIDIATSASWKQVKESFEAQGYSVFETGTAHGTVTVIVASQPIEITTYRSDGTYLDFRHPASVSFVRTIEEDLARRDFTINALAFHPDRGLFDPFDGLKDIDLHIIRTVGEAKRRFSEDALRIVRGVRFCSQLGFSLDKVTYSEMLLHAPLLHHIAAERISSELEGFLCGEHVHDALMDCVDVLGVIIPELLPMKNFDQRTPYHIYDVLEHTAYVLQNTPPQPLVRWSALFHDIGKPLAFSVDKAGTGHFYGHAKESVAITKRVMNQLKMPRRFIEDVLVLVKIHDDVIPSTTKAVKRALNRLGGRVDLFFALCDLKRGDALSQAPQYADRVELADDIERVAREIIANEEAFTLKNLAIDGHDLIDHGLQPGPRIGLLLNSALNAVIEETVPNNREDIIHFIETLPKP